MDFGCWVMVMLFVVGTSMLLGDIGVIVNDDFFGIIPLGNFTVIVYQTSEGSQTCSVPPPWWSADFRWGERDTSAF